MASIYRHRDGWQASVTIQGHNVKKNFTHQSDAKAWAEATATELRSAHEPHLGGPTRVTLAETLFEYAQHYTIAKKSAKSELDRINRYLGAAGLPRLKLVKGEQGQRELETLPPTLDDCELPRAFAALRGARCEAHSATAAVRAQLAKMKVARLKTMDFRAFITTMTSEGLSGSTVQKEIALLKHAFNMAIKEWNWSAFANPLTGVKLPSCSPGRDVVMSQEREAKLRTALAECDNPFILPLYDLAVETTARRGSLLNLTWDRVDLTERYILLWDTKSGHNVTTPLTLRAVEILGALKREAHNSRVFPVTANALHKAWTRACERAGEVDLHFHDARHVGTTRHARRLRNPDLLRQMTGHRSNQMLARYTHLMREDALEILDETEPSPPTPVEAQQPSSYEARRNARLQRQAGNRGTQSDDDGGIIIQTQPPAPRPTNPPHQERTSVDSAAASDERTVVVVDFGKRRRSA